MNAITLRRVDVMLGGNAVLREIDLDVGCGEWLALVGPNGAGKTTLLRAIAGLVPRVGHLSLNGIDPRTMSRRGLAHQVAFVPQQPAVPLGLTVADYALLGRTPFIHYLGVESRRDLDIVADLLRRLDLACLAGRPVGSLSGGEFQRSVLARALAQQAPVLLLDEPTAALDIGHAQQVMELVDQLRHEHGLTVVSAMHDLTITAQFAGRVLLLADGRSVSCGPARAVLTESSINEHYRAQVLTFDLPSGGVAIIPTRARAPRTASVSDDLEATSP